MQNEVGTSDREIARFQMAVDYDCDRTGRSTEEEIWRLVALWHTSGAAGHFARNPAPDEKPKNASNESPIDLRTCPYGTVYLASGRWHLLSRQAKERGRELPPA